MSGLEGRLRGRIVVVTRPRGQSAELTRGLARLGARVIAAPLIKTGAPRSFDPLDRSLRRLGRFDCVIFASQNAVRSFFLRAKALRLGPLPAPSRVYAVGAATAKTVRSFGWKPQPLAERYDGGALARAVRNVRGRRVLIPRAAKSREKLPRQLRRRGALVTCVEAYRTIRDEAGAGRLRAAARRGVDAVAFTSPSTVEQFVAALGLLRARRLLSGAAAVSIGPVTSTALKRKGLPLAAQAPRATAAGLVNALARHFHG